MIGVEDMDASYVDWIRPCREQLIEEGLLTYQEGQYLITKKGRQQVDNDLKRFQKMPARLVLIEQYMLERHGLTVD